MYYGMLILWALHEVFQHRTYISYSSIKPEPEPTQELTATPSPNGLKLLRMQSEEDPLLSDVDMPASSD